ncbi:MAG: hypothetical protein HY964_07745 [Ignavibacteriales bacterium]|nr:hypothetical protein [Ignavibacteriales bacterium]
MTDTPTLLQPTNQRSGERYVFIDLYRAAVILLMLEGHVLRAFLPISTQRNTFFQLHEFFHGLSAPAFLFGAGLTFVVSTRKRWEAYHHWDPPLARRLRRFLLVILLGLALHLPYYSFRKVALDLSQTEVLQLFQFDVLHCIGIGLLSLHGLIFFFKRESRFYSLVISTIIAVCFATPLIWDIDFLKYLSPFLSQIFNGNHGSPFPLFPYVGFLYAGVIVSWEFSVAVEEKREKKYFYWLTVVGMIFIIAGFVFDWLPWYLYPTYNYWFTSPNYFLVRLGSLMVIISAFWYFTQNLKNARKIFTVLGIESLFVYVLHLLVLYGSSMNPQLNMQVIFGLNRSFVETVGLFAGLFFLMLISALLWNYLKRKHFPAYRWVQIIVGGVFLYFLFTSDF